ncbi:ADAMTS-like protein 3 [Manis javanica]|nr:ADAMTS-like protein 3 [Manis javanica]
MVYITERTEVINILCELVTPGRATYTWTKDGEPIQPSEKVVLDGTGNLQIRSPTRKGQGRYRCSVVSHLGSDAGSSSVLYAEAPVILSVERNITRLEPGHLSVMVGGLVEAALGATMAIWCPVRGVGQPNVSWWKRGGSLGDNVSLLFNGSLLQNVSLGSEGTYVCRASNALGKPVAASTLRFLGQRWPDSKLVFSKDHKNHTLQASSPGNGSSDAIRKPLSPE